MSREIGIGQTDYTVLVFVLDAAQTDGSGKTGLVAANLTVSYTRVETDNDVVVTDVTGSLNDLTALTDAHTDWGLKEVSNTLAPGLYRLDLADAVFASGAWSAVVNFMITTSAASAAPMEFVMVPDAPIDGVQTNSFTAGAITATAIATDAIDADAMADGAITAATFAAGAIDATAIANGAIDAATFAAGAIDATAIANGAIDAATFAAGAIDAAAIAANAIDAATFAADVDAEVRGWLGLATNNLDTQLSTIDTVVDAILVDTGTTLDAKIDVIDGIVDAIKVATDSLTFTVAGEVDVNVQSVNDVTIIGDGSGTPFQV